MRTTMPTDRKITQVLLTFPRWNLTELKTLSSLIPSYTYCKICEEEHDEPLEGKSNIHYHVLYRPSHPITKKKIIAYFAKRFPDDWKRIDIQGVKSWKQAQTYLSKESLKILEDGTDETVKRTPMAPYDWGPTTYFTIGRMKKDLTNNLTELNRMIFEQDQVYLYEMMYQIRKCTTEEDLTKIEAKLNTYVEDYKSCRSDLEYKKELNAFYQRL